MIGMAKETLSRMGRPPETWGLLAEFTTPAAIYHACEKVRDAGYTKWDAHTPFPVHGLEKAMALKPSPLPIFCFVVGIGGAATAMFFQRWTAVDAYPLIISGKPLFSWPAFIPITFEFGVLCGSLTALLSVFGLSQLPRLHHPVFSSERFERASDDRFFISIEASDPKFDLDATRRLLEGAHATHVERIED